MPEYRQQLHLEVGAMILEIIILFVGTVIYYVWKFNRGTSYFTKLGIPQVENPSFLCGGHPITVKEVMKKEVHFNEVSLRQYKKFRDVPCYGSYMSFSPFPVLTAIDLDLIRNIYGRWDLYIIALELEQSATPNRGILEII